VQVALFGWPRQFHIGIFFPAPIWGWFAAPALVFVCAAVAYAMALHLAPCALTVAFGVGYLGTAFVAFTADDVPPL
jgi:hypothetical protein